MHHYHAHRVAQAAVNVQLTAIAFGGSRWLRELQAFRGEAKLDDLPGVDPGKERERLAAVLNELADALINGIESNPRKLWVMKRFQRFRARMETEDTEGREHFGMEVEQSWTSWASKARMACSVSAWVACSAPVAADPPPLSLAAHRP